MGDMFRRCWIRRIFMNEKCKKYDDMSDVFEYGNISDDEIVKLCNQILLESKDEKNDIILETMYHAVLRLQIIGILQIK